MTVQMPMVYSNPPGHWQHSYFSRTFYKTGSFTAMEGKGCPISYIRMSDKNQCSLHTVSSQNITAIQEMFFL